MSIRPPSSGGVTSSGVETLIDDRVQGGTDTNVATLLAGGSPTADCWYFGPLTGSGSVGEQVVLAAYDHSQLRYQAYVLSSNGRSWFVADNAPVIEADGDVKQPTTAGTIGGFIMDNVSDEAMEFYAAGALLMNLDPFVGPDVRSPDGTKRIQVTNTGVEIIGSGEALILASPDGTRWRVTISNAGALTTAAV